MEAQQQGQQRAGGKSVGVFSAGILVIIAFAAGVFVGLHPQWIPIKTSSGSPTDGMMPAGGMHSTTQPADPQMVPIPKPRQQCPPPDARYNGVQDNFGSRPRAEDGPLICANQHES